jgi:hypothetical protein
MLKVMLVLFFSGIALIIGGAGLAIYLAVRPWDTSEIAGATIVSGILALVAAGWIAQAIDD